MLTAAGLTVTGVWGGFNGAPYALDTARMIVRSDRTPNPPR
jgi:hypothetical protein